MSTRSKLNRGPRILQRSSHRDIASLDTGEEIATAAKSREYTGVNMIGIAQMHKSNAVPVFSEEDAVAISNMRR